MQFSVTATGADGQPLSNPTCSWVFDNNPSLASGNCSGSIALGPGTHTGKVTVNDAASTCSDTETSASVTVYPSITVSPTLTGDCKGDLGYAANASGGSGSFSYAWTFSPSGGTSTAASGAINNLSQGSYTGSVIVTDTHADGVTCKASGSASANVYTPLAVNLQAVTPLGQTCPGVTDDAATFAVAVSGGSGSYSYAWTGCSSTTNSCTIDPGATNYCASQNLSVLVTDALAMCGSKQSQTQSYAKITTITLTSNPPPQ